MAVLPCYTNQFKIGVPTSGGEVEKVFIADCETFDPSFDNTVEEWSPFDTEGWIRRLMTGKGITISVSAKRNVGDKGNDYVASRVMKQGAYAEALFIWVFPDGTEIEFENAIINVTNPGGGDSTAIAPLEFEVMSNGKPKVTQAA